METGKITLSTEKLRNGVGRIPTVRNFDKSFRNKLMASSYHSFSFPLVSRLFNSAKLKKNALNKITNDNILAKNCVLIT